MDVVACPVVAVTRLSAATTTSIHRPGKDHVGRVMAIPLVRPVIFFSSTVETRA
jgi:hypothetical protein